MEARRPQTPALLLAIIILASAAVSLAPGATALPPVTQAPTTLADSGKFAAIDQVGDAIVVAHVVGSARQLVFTVSTDGGVTWSDKIPSTTYSSAIYGVRLRVIDATHWAAALWRNQEQGVMVSTANGGTSFAETSLAYPVTTGSNYESSPLDIDGGIYSGSYYYIVGRSFHCLAGCSGNTIALDIWQTTNGGTSWTEVTSPVPDTTTRRVRYVSVDYEDSFPTWTVFYAREVTNGAGDYKLEAKRTTNSGSSYSDLPSASSSVINDPLSPLSAPYGNRVHVDHGMPGAYGTRTLVFECDGGKICVAKSQGNLGPTGGSFYIQALSSTAETCIFCEYFQVTTNGPPGAPYLFAIAWQETVASKYYHYANSTDGITYTVYNPDTATNTGYEQTPGLMVDPDGCGWVAYNALATDKLSLVKFGCPATVLGYRWNPQSWFCSDRGAEKFGFNYKEDVSFESDSNPVIGLDDAYKFTGDADNYAYLAKTLPTDGALGAKLFFTIEADSEGTDSVFRVAFSMHDHSSYDLGGDGHFLNGPDDPGANAKGDGLASEIFDEHLEIRFLEVSNDWRIQWYYVDSDGSVTTRTPIGLSTLADDPNTPTSYVATVDVRSGVAYAALRHADSTQVGSSSTDSLNVTIPSGLVGDVMYGQWYIGYATDTAFNNDARTYLNNNDGDAGSTCIYLLEEYNTATGEATTPTPDCVGQCGSTGPQIVTTPNGTVPENLVTCATSGTCTSGGTGGGTGGDETNSGNVFRAAGAPLPPGFSDATMDFFLGILFIAALTIGIAGAMYATTKSNAATKVGAMIGGGGGFLGSFALGLWPWWILTIVVVLALAGVFIARARSG